MMPAFAGNALASDDRVPTADELARITASLKAAGYTSWEEIEFDDGRWEVDDAIGADGREYDLKLDPATFEIVSTRLDD
jgi:hypothetical protein